MTIGHPHQAIPLFKYINTINTYLYKLVKNLTILIKLTILLMLIHNSNSALILSLCNSYNRRGYNNVYKDYFHKELNNKVKKTTLLLLVCSHIIINK